MSVTQVTTFVDLYTDLQNRVRDATGVTATQDIAKRWINTALHDMHIGLSERFPWAERRATLLTHAPYETGTVAINEGSATLTGTNTLWNTNNGDGVGNARETGRIQVGGGDEIYTIAASGIGSDTSITLAQNYVGNPSTGIPTAFADGGGGTVNVTDASHGIPTGGKVVIQGTTNYDGTYTTNTNTTDVFNITATWVSDDVANDAPGTWTSRSVSGVAHKYFEDEYALAADFARPIDQRSFESGGFDIQLMGRTEFRRQFPRNFTFAKPRIATITDHLFNANTTPVRRIRFHPVPDAVYLIPYSYITSYLAVTAGGAEQTQLSSDTDEPIVPLRYRHALVFHALYHWYRDRKDDPRSQEAKIEYVSILQRIAADFEIGQAHPSIRPRRGSYVRGATNPYSRGGSRKYDINDRFDRLEDR